MINSKNFVVLIFTILLLVSYQFAQSGTDRWRLVWDKNEEPDMFYYIIYRSENPFPVDSISKKIHEPLTTNSPTMSFIDSTISKGVRYYYRLKAVDSTYLKSDFSDTVSASVPRILEIPNRNIYQGQQFDLLKLDDYVTDPDLKSGEEITWKIRLLGDNTIGVDTAIRDDNILNLSPNPMENIGSVTLEFTATDPDTFFDVRTATFSVNPLDIIANDNSYPIYLNETIDTLDVLWNDNIPPGRKVRIDSVVLSGSGYVELNADSLSVKYIAPFTGETDWFDYILKDLNEGDTSKARVYISLYNFKANEDNFLLSLSNPELFVTLNDDFIRSNESNITPLNESVIVDIVTYPVHGSVVKENDTTFVYTPFDNITGSLTDQFQYHIHSDRLNRFDTTSVFISINYPGEDIFAYPIPLQPSQGGASEITFSNLPEGGKLLIYDLLGYPVYEMDISQSQETWSTLNQHGKWVRSGLYLYAVKNAKGKVVKTDKVIIIR